MNSDDENEWGRGGDNVYFRTQAWIRENISDSLLEVAIEIKLSLVIIVWSGVDDLYLGGCNILQIWKKYQERTAWGKNIDSLIALVRVGFQFNV